VARKVTTSLQRVKGSVVARWKVGARPVLMLNNFLEMEFDLARCPSVLHD
jgi:hypothetical protein